MTSPTRPPGPPDMRPRGLDRCIEFLDRYAADASGALEFIQEFSTLRARRPPISGPELTRPQIVPSSQRATTIQQFGSNGKNSQTR